MGIIVCLFAVFTCRQINLITESWHGIIKYRYNNYHGAFWKRSLSCYLKIWVFPLWACLVRQLRPRNLVIVEADCQLSVHRLTPQLCSQVCRVLLLLHPVLLECPTFLQRGWRKPKCWQSKPSGSLENLELPERKPDESWNTSFIVNISEDQAFEIEGKDESFGRGRQTNLKQVFLRLEGKHGVA